MHHQVVSKYHPKLLLYTICTPFPRRQRVCCPTPAIICQGLEHPQILVLEHGRVPRTSPPWISKDDYKSEIFNIPIPRLRSRVLLGSQELLWALCFRFPEIITILTFVITMSLFFFLFFYSIFCNHHAIKLMFFSWYTVLGI